MQELFLGKMMFIRCLFSSRRESQCLNNVLNYGILGYRDFQTQTHVTDRDSPSRYSDAKLDGMVD